MSVLSDFRFALRSLLRVKGLAATVIATLALGIGANAAIFSVVNGVLLRPLVNRDEDRLIYIRQSARGIGAENASGVVAALNVGNGPGIGVPPDGGGVPVEGGGWPPAPPPPPPPHAARSIKVHSPHAVRPVLGTCISKSSLFPREDELGSGAHGYIVVRRGSISRRRSAPTSDGPRSAGRVQLASFSFASGLPESSARASDAEQ